VSEKNSIVLGVPDDEGDSVCMAQDFFDGGVELRDHHFAELRVLRHMLLGQRGGERGAQSIT
jgi:hypothetical protein